jgi:hypothetical protein
MLELEHGEVKLDGRFGIADSEVIIKNFGDDIPAALHESFAVENFDRKFSNSSPDSRTM